MPRDISVASLAKVTQQYGAEPMVILEIQWTEGGQRYKYGDKDVAPDIRGRIQSVGNLDAVVQVSNGGDSAELSVVLADVDGEIKTIMDQNDIHKRPCWVYQWFEGIDPDEKFLIFKGFISSPLTWNEGDRTVSFDVISKIEDTEVGFSIEEGDVENPPQDLLGKPWPLCFGTVIDAPALQVKALLQGTTAQGVGIMDPTLRVRLECARLLKCPINFEAYKIVYAANGPFSVSPFFAEDPNCLKQKCEIIEGLTLQLDEQHDFEFTQIQIYGGEKFPQNTLITLDIDGGFFKGRMNGDIFTITSRRHPSVAANGDIDLGNTRNTIKSQCGNSAGFPPGFYAQHKSVIDRYMESAQTIDNIYDLAKAPSILKSIISFAENFTPQAPTPEEVTGSAVASRYSFEFLNLLPTLDFFWANGGSKVTLTNDKEIIYIANLLPSTVHRVAAYRQLDNGRQLVTVPASYYTVRQTNYTGYTGVVEIVFDRPLSSRKDGWEDNIFVTLTSSVGPNTVDEMQWLIETYTDFEIDTTSFDEVHDLIDNYPSHFMVPGRMNVVELLQKMAYQSRCALYLRDDKFYIKYLSADPTVIDTISKSDMELNSFELFHTETEDLVTKYVIDWRESYAAEEPNKVILRHNVKKYGTHEETDDFFIYNILELVKKSATFWLIRKANTWRKVRCRTYFNKLKLETFDCAQVTHTALADSAVKCIVEKADFDSASRRMDFEIWTPILSGSRVPYDFAYPADIEEKLLWPTVEERIAGKAGSGKQPNFSVIAPNNHPLSNPTAPQVSLQCSGGQSIPPGAEISSFCRGDHGDSKPSDRNDTKPVPKRPKDTSGEINTGTNPLRTGPQEIINKFAKDVRDAKDEAKKAREDAARANQNAGGDQSYDPEEPDPDGAPPGEDDPQRKLPQNQSGGNCTVDVVSTFALVNMIHRHPGEDPYFGQDPGDQGVIVDATVTHVMRQTYNSMAAAQAAKATQDAIIAQLNDYQYIVGQEQLFQVGLSAPNLGTDTNPYAADGSANPNYNQPCAEPSSGSQAQTGFTYNPFVS